MNALRTCRCAAGRWIWPVVAAWLLLASRSAGAAEDKFDVLQIGTRTYKNVTVTTKATNYIFIVHAAGMASIKTSDLPPEVKEKLGYAAIDGPKRSTNAAAVWAKREVAKLNAPQIKELEVQLKQKLREDPSASLAALGLTGATVIYVVLGIALLLYLCQSYCCMLICLKTGNPPGFLVWVPVLQLIPLLRAADMSGWWFLAFFVPGLNLVAGVIWCFKIAAARGKSAWVGVLLLLPVTSLFAFLYLAFSRGASEDEDKRREPQIMTLEIA